MNPNKKSKFDRLQRVLGIAFSSLALTSLWVGVVRSADNPTEKSKTFAVGSSNLPTTDLPQIRKLRNDLRVLLRRKLKIQQLPDPSIQPGMPARIHECVAEYESCKGDARKLIFTVAAHVRLSDKLLSQENEDVKRSGLGIAMHACSCSLTRLNDPQLASAIADAYILPNLSTAHAESWQFCSRLGAIKLATSTYLQSKDFRKMESAARVWIEIADNQNATDAGKLFLARSLHEQHKVADAVEVLKTISDSTGVAGSKALIPEFEKSLKKDSKKP